MELEEKVCRTCLDSGIPLESLNVKFEDEIQGRKMLEFLLGSNIEDSDAFSEICETCRTNLIFCYSFKLQCLASEEKIKQYTKVAEILPDPLGGVTFEVLEKPQLLLLPKEKEEDTFEDAPPESEPETSPVPSEQQPEPKIKGKRCRACDITFPDRNSYDRHRKKEHIKMEPIVFACNFCNISFPDRTSRNSHYSHNHRNHKKPLGLSRCTRCDATFPDCNARRRHVAREHSKEVKNPIRAPDDKISTMSEHKPVKPRRKLTDLTPATKPIWRFYCTRCGIRFPDEASRVSHYNKNHRKAHKINKGHVYPTAMCEDCGKTVSASNLKTHRLTHKGRTFFCAICGGGFTAKNSVRTHMRVHTKEKTFFCKYCNKGFIHWDTRQNHIRAVHETDVEFRKHECHLCGRKFERKSRLTIHMRCHTDEKLYKCSICPKSYRSNCSLSEHLVSHSKEKNFICKVCSKAFGTKKCLRQHMATHEERKHICDVCSRAFTQRHVLRSHRRAVHPEYPELPSKAIVLYRINGK